jgi:hypothetical protein
VIHFLIFIFQLDRLALLLTRKGDRLVEFYNVQVWDPEIVQVLEDHEHCNVRAVSETFVSLNSVCEEWHSVF